MNFVLESPTTFWPVNFRSNMHAILFYSHFHLIVTVCTHYIYNLKTYVIPLGLECASLNLGYYHYYVTQVRRCILFPLNHFNTYLKIMFQSTTKLTLLYICKFKDDYCKIVTKTLFSYYYPHKLILSQKKLRYVMPSFAVNNAFSCLIRSHTTMCYLLLEPIVILNCLWNISYERLSNITLNIVELRTLYVDYYCYVSLPNHTAILHTRCQSFCKYNYLVNININACVYRSCIYRLYYVVLASKTQHFVYVLLSTTYTLIYLYFNDCRA